MGTIILTSEIEQITNDLGIEAAPYFGAAAPGNGQDCLSVTGDLSGLIQVVVYIVDNGFLTDNDEMSDVVALPGDGSTKYVFPSVVVDDDLEEEDEEDEEDEEEEDEDDL